MIWACVHQSDYTGFLMPLTATFDPGHNHYPSEKVYFFMKDCDRRVRCGVSELALEAFEPKFERSKEGRLVAFNKHRAHSHRKHRERQVRSERDRTWRPQRFCKCGGY
jgi:hypothetical protein